ncbi:MAG: hypothetical protein A2020_03585 [Lentisphaerae bacterium GWF2_45_14]|nr:MAG: hypothetical protein A2020_03585 [Lentisphaerae bacterium GWF2_45_14]
MNFRYALAAICIALAGCSGIEYTGAEYPKTISSRIFYDSKLIPENDYVKIGDAEITAYAGDKSIDIDDRLIAKGKAVGADVILVTGEKTLAEEADIGKDKKTDSAAAVPKRVAVYKAETIIRACFFKEKISINQYNEDEKYKAEGEENPNIVYIDKAQQKKLVEEKKQYNDTMESKNQLPGTLGSPEAAQEEFNKEFNPQNLNDPVYKKFEKDADSSQAQKVAPLENPPKLYGVPEAEQKKYDKEYKQIIDRKTTGNIVGNPENSIPPDMKQIDKDIDNLIKNIKNSPAKEIMKDVEDNIK